MLTTSYATNRKYHQSIIDYALDHPNLLSMQALAILSFSYTLSASISRLSGAVAILARFVRSASLHEVDVPHDHHSFSKSLALLPPTTILTELEERRRLFWSVFMLDGLLSA